MALSEAGADELSAPYERANGKRMVHTTIALNAEDQLRQRVAWALSQIFVIGESGLAMHTMEHEIWLSYYDIFVRHAFGSRIRVRAQCLRRPT